MNFSQASEPVLDAVSCNIPRVTLPTPEAKAGLGEVDCGACDFIHLSGMMAYESFSCAPLVPQLSTEDYSQYPSVVER